MRAGIALGSNIEPRLQNLQAAHQLILKLHTGSEPVLGSKVYETSPVDCAPETFPFLNAVMEIGWKDSPEELHCGLQKIEHELGRATLREKNSPRTIDLDLLYCDDCVVETSTLTLPHPRISERQFVLQPLADIRPELLLPNHRRAISGLLHSLTNDEKLSEYKCKIL